MKEELQRLNRRQSVILAMECNGNGVQDYSSLTYSVTAQQETSTTLINVASTATLQSGSFQDDRAPLNWRNILWKIAIILSILYFFVCSLGFLSDALRLIAGRKAGEVLQQDKLISNPIVGVMMGILVTVAVQSSSTSTSIVVSMVASGIFPLRTALPIIFGCNVGTSATNTVVALTHMKNREDFERAFSGAVLHDMFNLLTVTTLLIVEQLTRYLENTTTAILDNFDWTSKKGGEIQVLSVLTKPFTSLIVQIDKDVIIGWSIKDPYYENARLLKVWCNSSRNDSSVKAPKKCTFLFNAFEMGDVTVGVILLVASLVLLVGCLICLVKVLSSLLQGRLALAVQKAINANISWAPWLTGYLAIAIGAIMTILVQSSSVFTSAMTPLIALGMISLERAYPLTLGSNLGTTTTALLAALAAEGPNFRWSLQLAFCHFLFNFTGIMLFYPIPFTRFPIAMAASLGAVTAKYRWFAIFYLVFMFLVLPLIIFTLSMIGRTAFYIVLAPSVVITLAVLLLSIINRIRPEVLPEKLKTWNFLPIWVRSLEPYDRLVQRCVLTFRQLCWKSSEKDEATFRIKSSHSSAAGGLDNLAFSSVLIESTV